MKKFISRLFKRTASVLLVALLVCTGVTVNAYTTNDYSDATTQAYEAELDRLRREQAELESTLALIRDNQSSASEYGELLTKQLQSTSNKVEVAQEYIAVLEQGISDKKAEIAHEEENINRTYNNLLQRMRITYEQSDENFLDILLNSKSLADLLSRVERLSSLLDYDNRLKRSYEEAKQFLEAAKADLDEKYATQTALEAELAEDVLELEKLIRDNDAYIDTLESNEAYAYQEHVRREEEKNKLAKELDDYIAEQLRNSQAEYVGGQFRWPLNGATNYVVTCRHGWRTYQIYGYWTTDYHNGIDLRCYTGTEVYAANSGTVIIATYHASYGYYVLIDHGGGYSTLYAHNSQLLVTPGQHVEMGQVISLSGNTGYTSGPHLHFEIRVNNERVDPLSGNLLSTPKNMLILE